MLIHKYIYIYILVNQHIYIYVRRSSANQDHLAQWGTLSVGPEACLFSTGFQLVDGKERLIVVEGLAEGALQRIQDIALQALTGALPQPSGTCRRTVHWHSGLRSVVLHAIERITWSISTRLAYML